MLYFNNPYGTWSGRQLERIETGLIFNLISKGHPRILDKRPAGYADIYYNGNIPTFAISLRNINGIEKYFFRVIFEDIDGKLQFNTSSGLTNLLNSKIIDAGFGDNFLDTGFISQVMSNISMIGEYIFIKDRLLKEAYLYIPVEYLYANETYMES